MSVGAGLDIRTIPPKVWIHIPEVDLDVYHLGPGVIDLVVTSYGTLMLSSSGWWEVRRHERGPSSHAGTFNV